MKFRVMMKDPDGVWESMRDAVDAMFDATSRYGDDDETRDLARRKLSDFASRWLEHGEYLTVEFDTEAKTCVVVEPKAK